MEYVYDKEYFQDVSPKLQYLYAAYSLSGGMYYEAYMNTWFKYFWNFLHLTSILLVVPNCTIVLVELQAYDFSSLFLAVSHLGFEFLSIFIALSTYSWRKTFRKLFQLAEKFKDDETDSVQYDAEDNNGYKIIDLTAIYQMFPKFVILGLISYFIFKVPRCFYRFGFDGTFFAINYIKDYIFPFLFVKSPSPLTYFIICVVQMFTNVNFALMLYSSPLLLYTVTISLKNQVVALKRRIQIRSKFTYETLERSFANESEILETKVPRHVQQKRLLVEQKIREKCLEEFFNHLCFWIRGYQELIVAANLIKGSLEIIFHLIIVVGFWVIMFCGYQLRETILHFDKMDHENFFTILAAPVTIFICCWIGGMFAELGTEIAEELYETPWYYLPPNKRKVFLTFLCLTQKPRTLRIFKQYAITLSLFLIILRKAYDIIQLIWVIEKKARV